MKRANEALCWEQCFIHYGSYDWDYTLRWATSLAFLATDDNCDCKDRAKLADSRSFTKAMAWASSMWGDTPGFWDQNTGDWYVVGNGKRVSVLRWLSEKYPENNRNHFLRKTVYETKFI